MGWMNRLSNLFRRDKVGEELEEELQSRPLSFATL